MNDLTPELAAVVADITTRLVAAAADRRAAMHTPVIGTADGDLRIMVLRACDGDLAALRFHTDARSPKTGLIGAGAPISLLAYDPAARIQIRARGQARIERAGPQADPAWNAASAFARRCYLAEAAPGTPADRPLSGLPADLEGQRPDAARLALGRANFAVLLVTLTALDWLHLAHTGHRRAQLTRGGADRPWQGTWVVP